jgi:hypothetical protein
MSFLRHFPLSFDRDTNVSKWNKEWPYGVSTLSDE